MKIGLFTHATPPGIGGGHIFRDELEKAAMKRGGRHQFAVVDVPPPTPMQRIRRKLYGLRGRSLYTRPYVSEPLQREVARLRLDLLWFNHAEPAYIGLPYVLNIFDLQHRLQPWFPEVSADGEWEHRESYLEKAIKRATIVTVGSRNSKEQLCHFYGVPLDNVHVLPFPTPQSAIDLASGMRPSPDTKAVRAKYEIKNDFLFYPAQFWPHKNHINLLRALRILRDQKGLDISLVLTGSDQGNLSYVKKTAKDLELTGNVHFCGFVPHEDVMAFYREALALSFVSFFGPENLPPLEAMALGCPVILSDIPGVRDLHGDGPILVDPRSPQSIADGIGELQQNPGQTAERVAAGKRIAVRNDSQAYFAQFQDMLDAFRIHPALLALDLERPDIRSDGCVPGFLAVRIGLYAENFSASTGGGYVFRDNIAEAAARQNGPHKIELVGLPRKSLGGRIKGRLEKEFRGRLGLAPSPAETPAQIAPRMARDVAQRKLDLLWFHHLIPIHAGVPYILNIFDLQHRLQPWFPEVSNDGQWEEREEIWSNAIRRAAIVTVGSTEAREQLCRFYGVPPENVKVLPFPTPQGAVDAALDEGLAGKLPDVRAKYKIEGDFLFYPAQFWPHKNHVNLLRALKILNANSSAPLSLVLTGSDQGNSAHVRRTAEELGIAEQVRFCGFVDYNGILALYREARALTYVSFFGPENLPPLEAMVLGCPVILSDIPGVRALHGDGPMLVDPHDPRSIAQGIKDMLDDSRLPARLAAGRTLAIANSCEKYLETFQQILNEFEPIRRCWP